MPFSVFSAGRFQQIDRQENVAVSGLFNIPIPSIVGKCTVFTGEKKASDTNRIME